MNLKVGNEISECPAYSIHYPQSKNCLYLLAGGYDWISGQNMCNSLGMHLVIINSVYVKLSVIDLISQSSLKGVLNYWQN